MLIEQEEKIIEKKKKHWFYFRGKIGMKLAFFLFLVGLLPLVVFGVIFIRSEQANLEKEIFDKLALFAESKEAQVFVYFDAISSRTIDFASDGFIRDQTRRIVAEQSSRDRQLLNEHLRNNKKPLDATLAGISVLDQNGIVIASTDENEIGKDDSKDAYFIEGKKTPSVEWGDPHFNIAAPLVAAAPLTDKDTHELIGVIVNVFDPHKLEEILSGSFIIRQGAESVAKGRPETLDVYLVDKNKRVIMRPISRKDGIIPEIIDTLPVRKCFEKKEEMVGAYANYANAEVLGASMCLIGKKLALIVEVDKKAAFMPVDEARAQFYGIIAALIALIIIISFLISRILTKPIKALQESAETVRAGNLQYRAEIAKTGDEIEELGHAFNAMTAALEERQRWVEEEKKKLAVLLENLPVGVLMARAPRGEIVALNGRGALLLGNDFQSDPDWWKRIKKEDGGQYPPKELPAFVALETGHATTKNDLYIEKAGEKMVALRMTAVPVRDDTGTLRFVAVVFDDVTKEKEVDRAKTEFVSLASHQLRTPLSSINWYSEMLLDEDAGKITKEQKKYLREIYRGNKRMVELVDALLNVSRLEMGTFSVEPAPMNAVAAAKSALADFKQAIKKKKIVLKESYGKDIPQMMADPKLMRIIFQNLLSNAVKYTQERGIISFTVEALKKGQSAGGKKMSREMLLIKVADTGYGIPKEQHNKIFTKMFRADNVRERDPEGTGLGLYLVKSIAEHVNGSVWFESEEEKGATFYLVLPLEGMQKKAGTRQLG